MILLVVSYQWLHKAHDYTNDVDYCCNAITYDAHLEDDSGSSVKFELRRSTIYLS